MVDEKISPGYSDGIKAETNPSNNFGRQLWHRRAAEINYGVEYEAPSLWGGFEFTDGSDSAEKAAGDS